MSWLKEHAEQKRLEQKEEFCRQLWHVRSRHHSRLLKATVARALIDNTPGEPPVSDDDFFVLSSTPADRLTPEQVAVLERYQPLAEAYDVFFASLSLGAIDWLVRLRRQKPVKYLHRLPISLHLRVSKTVDLHEPSIPQLKPRHLEVVGSMLKELREKSVITLTDLTPELLAPEPVYVPEADITIV